MGKSIANVSVHGWESPLCVPAVTCSNGAIHGQWDHLLNWCHRFVRHVSSQFLSSRYEASLVLLCGDDEPHLVYGKIWSNPFRQQRGYGRTLPRVNSVAAQ